MKRVLILTALAAISSSAAAQVPVALSEFKLELPRDTMMAGSVTFRVSNSGRISHALYVRGPGVDQGTREIPAGQGVSLKVTLKPGTYEVYCPLADGSHKMAGMTKQLVVTPSAPFSTKKPGS